MRRVRVIALLANAPVIVISKIREALLTDPVVFVRRCITVTQYLGVINGHEFGETHFAVIVIPSRPRFRPNTPIKSQAIQIFAAIRQAPVGFISHVKICRMDFLGGVPNARPARRARPSCGVPKRLYASVQVGGRRHGDVARSSEQGQQIQTTDVSQRV